MVSSVAVIMTVHNRKAKTLRCLDSLHRVWTEGGKRVGLSCFITDDGCTDGTSKAVLSRNYEFPVHLILADGTLFWCGGMIKAWNAALCHGRFDGYLWLNDDTEILPGLINDIVEADEFCLGKYGRSGIYVGSTKDADTGNLSYGGFNYVNKWTLLDQFVIPDGKSFQPCEAAHGNITYVSSGVVEKLGIFYPGYHHGGADHDYTYLAHKAGFPVLVLPHFSGICDNDHPKDGGRANFFALPVKERVKQLNLHNTLLFNRRCFPLRLPIVLISGYSKVLFPKFCYRVYLMARGVKL